MNFSQIDDRLTYYQAKIQLWEYLKQRADGARAVRHSKRAAVRDPEALGAYVEEFREFFIQSIGGLPETMGQVKATCTGEIDFETFTVQKLLLETRPGVKATANMYLPKGQPEKGPAILFLCGHSTEGKAVERYQVVSQMLVSRGFVVLILDPTGQGERLGYYDPNSGGPRVRAGTGDHEYSGLQCTVLGHNLCRYMLHDAIRAMDYLCDHPRVDASRIGITGSSGGGTQSSLMMLIEPRIAAAAPATFVTTRQAIFDSGYGQDAEQIWPKFGGEGYDHVDLLLSFAPKPLCVLSVEFDFFPIEGTRQTVHAARRFWEMFGKEECFQAVEDRSVHRYTDRLAATACDFFAHHFGMPPVKEIPVGKPLPPADLNVTRTGQVLGDFPDSKTVFFENLEWFARSVQQQDKALDFLREAVFRNRFPTSPNLRITQETQSGNMLIQSGFWWSQKGLLNSGILFRSADTDPSVSLPVTLALWEDGTRDLCRHDGFIRKEVSLDRAVLVLNVTGMGPLEPYPFNATQDLKVYYGTFFRICDDLISLGDSFAALRTFDVLQCMEMLESWGGLDIRDLRLYLQGPYGIYGALAACLEPRLRNDFRWDSPLPAYEEILRSRYYNDRDIKSLIVPGLLTHADWTDLAETTGLLGNRDLGSTLAGLWNSAGTSGNGSDRLGEEATVDADIRSGHETAGV